MMTKTTVNNNGSCGRNMTAQWTARQDQELHHPYQECSNKNQQSYNQNHHQQYAEW